MLARRYDVGILEILSSRIFKREFKESICSRVFLVFFIKKEIDSVRIQHFT